MGNKKLGLAICLMVGLLMALAMVSGPALWPALAAIPTPVAEVAGGGDWVMATYSIGGDFTNVYDTATGSGIHDPAYTAADISWTFDISGTIQVTCTLAFSNDNTNWADGVNIVNAVTADVTNMDQFNLFGRYSRVECTEYLGQAGHTYTATIIGKLIN